MKLLERIALCSVLGLIGCNGVAAPGKSPNAVRKRATVTGPTVDQLLALTANCTSDNMVSDHTYPDPGSAENDVPICALNGAVYFDADMDIDCDGRAEAGCPGDDPSYQPDTAFHNGNGDPLAARVTPYVGIPNDCQYPGLDTNNGGNVIAVIFGGQLQYAVFGDTGPTNLIGEASKAT